MSKKSSESYKSYVDYIQDPNNSPLDETASKLAKTYITDALKGKKADEVHKYFYENKGNMISVDGEDSFSMKSFFDMYDNDGSFRKNFLANEIINTYGSKNVRSRSISKEKSDPIIKRDLEELLGNFDRDEYLENTPPKAVTAALGGNLYKSAVMDEGEGASTRGGGKGGTDVRGSYGIPFIETEYRKDGVTGVPDSDFGNIPAVVDYKADIMKEDPSLYDLNDDGVIDVLDIMQIENSEGKISPNRLNENESLKKAYNEKKANIDLRMQNKLTEAKDQQELWDEQVGWSITDLFESGQPIQWAGNALAKTVASPMNIFDMFSDVSHFYDSSDYQYNPELNEWGDKKYRKLVNEYFKIEKEGDRLDNKYEHTNSVYQQDINRDKRSDTLKTSIYGPEETRINNPTGVGLMTFGKDEDGNAIFDSDDIFNILDQKERVK